MRKSHFAGENDDIVSLAETADDRIWRAHRIGHSRVAIEFAIAVAAGLLLLVASTGLVDPRETAETDGSHASVLVPTHGHVLPGRHLRSFESPEAP